MDEELEAGELEEALPALLDSVMLDDCDEGRSLVARLESSAPEDEEWVDGKSALEDGRLVGMEERPESDVGLLDEDVATLVVDDRPALEGAWLDDEGIMLVEDDGPVLEEA